MADFLLLHGMNVGAWEWERVIPLLEADPRAGTIVAPQMPGRDGGRPRDLRSTRLRDYAETVLRALREHDLRDTVVVGHSAGGVCIQAASAVEPERVRRMVFLCAAVPRRGESVLGMVPQPQRTVARTAMWLLRTGTRGIVANRATAKRALCNDLKPDDCERILNHLVPEPQALVLDRLDWPAERVRAPATYILTTEDRVIRPKQQQRMARNVPNAEIVRFEMGHVRPVMEPEQLAHLLLSYA